MKKSGCEQGFTLIELTFFMVVISLAVVGVAPLVNRVFSNLHMPTAYAQGYFLAQAALEQTYARNNGGEFEQIVFEENCLAPDRTTPLVTGFSMSCRMDVVGATFDADTGEVTCMSDLDGNENYKCVTVIIHHNDTDEVIARKEGSIPRL